MTTEESLNRLPQHEGYWYTGYRRIPAWLTKEEDKNAFFQPWVIFVVDMESGAIIQITVLDAPMEDDELFEFFTRCMTTPAQNSIRPQRPKEIQFEFKDLTEKMGPYLTPLNISALHNPQPEVVEEILAHLLPVITGGQVPLPGLMEQHGVKEETFKNIFHLAKQLWDLQPWKTLENEDILEVRVGNQKKPYYISMMGFGGMEFGFAVFKTLSELKTFFVQTELKFFKLPPSGRHVFLFNTPPLVSFNDLHFIETHQLPLPEEGYIPTPLWFKPDDLNRPTAHMLRWYEAFLSAFPLFYADLLKDGTQTLTKTYLSQTSKKIIPVTINFPAFEKIEISQWKLDGTYDFLRGTFINDN